MNSTIRLYDLDSYVREFDAEVLSCEKITAGMYSGMYGMILDRTAFFPEGGGQASDTGYFLPDRRLSTSEEAPEENRLIVKDVHISDGIITHYIEPAGAFEASCEMLPAPGTQIKGYVDFAVRFDRMQQHSGEHLLSGHVSRLFGYSNVGFHLSDDVTTVDFDGTFSDTDLKNIEIAVNEAVYSNTACEIFYPSPEELITLEYRSKKELEGAVRIVRFGNFDTCACCAPHVKRSGEIGLFKILSAEHFRGGTRMTIVYGMRALKAFAGFQDSVRSISQLLSVKPDEVAEGVFKLKDNEKNLKFENIRLEKELFAEKIDLLTQQSRTNSPVPFIFTEKANTDNAREAANRLAEIFPGYCGVFTGNDCDGYSFIIGSKDSDCTALMNILKTELDAGGGGKKTMIQGKVFKPRETILNTLKQLSRSAAS
ncbi:MAG: alanyl-tRNA editing protein [Lachnospiraceae bacterium]|nr:alanyl-tRNA editing protein [Lachnospiraceae bacterium]